jgi:hypothetical protein
MSSFCDKVKQMFRDISFKDSCVSTCCITNIDKDDDITTHRHHNKHTHKHKEHKPNTKKTQDENER